MQSSLGRGEKWRQRLWLCLIYMQVASPKNCCLTVHVFRLSVFVCVCVQEMLCSKDYETETASGCEQFSSAQFNSGKSSSFTFIWSAYNVNAHVCDCKHTHTHTRKPLPKTVWESASHIVYLIGCLSGCLSECLNVCLCVYLLYHLPLPADNLYCSEIFNLIKALPAPTLSHKTHPLHTYNPFKWYFTIYLIYCPTHSYSLHRSVSASLFANVCACVCKKQKLFVA